MSKRKYIYMICGAVILLAVLSAFLFVSGKNDDEFFTKNDGDASWSTSDATEIVLSDGGSSVKGAGAYVSDRGICIEQDGKYVISGGLSNGSILVDADKDDKIWMMLDNASIHCEDDAAVRIEQAGKVFLTLKEGTDNSVSSGPVYGEDAVSSKVDGTIYSRDDLTINGGGSIRVAAQYQHGIVCNDDLVITGGTIAVTAVKDGFHANDSVRIRDADITVSAGDDGITVSNDDETAYLYIESGNIRIPSCYEGMEAVRVMIAGGIIDIASEDDGINAGGSGDDSVLSISGGEIAVTVENGKDADGIDSNKDLFVSGGKILISVDESGANNAIDYGDENDGVCEITGGTILACGSSAMVKGFDPSSAQGFVVCSTSAPAGTTVTVRDAGGSELLSETVPCSFSSVVVSTPDMKIGDTCTITVGETETELKII